ncbi:carbohydrate ABC transporter permease [Paenibacillus sp. CN-4]|uniref:carbohydrate ABC transporter permease n=1 Tax=Paenibacillus nanchangensis TaxID=3348343 RepID=UPI00397BE7D6
MAKLRRFFIYGFLTAAAFVSVFPFFWMIVGSTNPSVEVTRGRLLPGTYLAENFSKLLETTDLRQSMLNSAQISITTTVLSLLIASLAGYGFEMFRSRLKDAVFTVLLLSMMIPFAALMVPLYRMFADVTGTLPWIGIDTFASVILPTAATAFLIFFFRQSTKMFPRELVEAGRIDGLGELGIFLRIFVPTMRTTYAAGAIITFMASWNSYLWPLVVLQSPENRTMPLLISILGSGYAPDYGMILMAIVIGTLPTALVFFLMQKQFVAGMIGSVK